MKYKLINRATHEAHICDKDTIGGLDYYVSDEKATEGFYGYIHFQCGDIKKVGKHFADDWKKVIATNNPSIDIPKVIDEVDYLYKNHKQTFIWEPAKEGLFHFKAGYSKSQETHPNSDEDTIEFAEFVGQYYADIHNSIKETKELLELWKSQQPKVLYYEEN